MQQTRFPTHPEAIRQRLRSVHPERYRDTRNNTDGAVSKLSPYISRGWLTLPQVAGTVLQQFSKAVSEKWIQELAWREYFQRVWEAKGTAIETDLRFPQQPVRFQGIPGTVLQHQTGVHQLNRAIEELETTGYLHNHLRMYLASVTCNLAGYHWRHPANWMYFHLLDGDLASNFLSWQWVAGSFSSKKYYCNQHNINQYTKTNESNTWLDVSYDALHQVQLPEHWQRHQFLQLTTPLPETPPIQWEEGNEVFVYTHYTLDPDWRQGEAGTRILILEPDHFNRYPVGPNVMQFILDLASQIAGMQVYVGSFSALQQEACTRILCYKNHPITRHFAGMADAPAWLFPGVSGYYPSFSKYWEVCRGALKRDEVSLHPIN